VPVRVSVGEAEILADGAAVTMELFWAGNREASERVVTVERIEGAWRITDVDLPAE